MSSLQDFVKQSIRYIEWKGHGFRIMLHHQRTKQTLNNWNLGINTFREVKMGNNEKREYSLIEKTIE